MKVIVTGASGMVGEGVLLQCLQNKDVEAVLVVGRRPCGITHAKLKEILHSDFYDITPIMDQLKGYDACFFCLGVSSVGMKEPDYTKVTHDLTLHVATVLAQQNPGMTFVYVSGAGTDSTEKGRSMWARVKGRTENDLMKLPFKAAYMFRPGMMKATPGQKNLLKAYKYFAWMYPVLRTLFPASACKLSEVGDAMIYIVKNGYDKRIIDVKDMVKLAKQ